MFRCVQLYPLSSAPILRPQARPHNLRCMNRAASDLPENAPPASRAEKGARGCRLVSHPYPHRHEGGSLFRSHALSWGFVPLAGSLAYAVSFELRGFLGSDRAEDLQDPPSHLSQCRWRPRQKWTSLVAKLRLYYIASNCIVLCCVYCIFFLFRLRLPRFFGLRLRRNLEGGSVLPSL